MVQIEAEQLGFFAFHGSSCIHISHLPCMLLQVAVIFFSPLFFSMLGFFCFDFCKGSCSCFISTFCCFTPFSRLLSSRSPLCTLGEHGTVCTASRCLWAEVLSSCKSWPCLSSFLFILTDKWYFLGFKCGCSSIPNCKCSYHVCLWNVNSCASSGWICCQMQYA